CAATRRGCGQWRSRRTAAPSPRAAPTAPPASGGWSSNNPASGACERPGDSYRGVDTPRSPLNVSTMTQAIRIGVVTVSDRASRGEYQDLGGPAIRDALTDILSCDWQ